VPPRNGLGCALLPSQGQSLRAPRCGDTSRLMLPCRARSGELSGSASARQASRSGLPPVLGQSGEAGAKPVAERPSLQAAAPQNPADAVGRRRQSRRSSPAQVQSDRRRVPAEMTARECDDALPGPARRSNRASDACASMLLRTEVSRETSPARPTTSQLPVSHHWDP